MLFIDALYILHCIGPHQIRVPWYLTRHWEANPMIRFSKVTKRLVSRKLNLEWQADMWAICALLRIGATDDLQAVLTHYPEKTGLIWVSIIGSIYASVKSRLKRAFSRILHPFTA
jgi:hypothetical protein